MVAHFWIAQYGGMAWSAVAAAIGILAAGLHISLRLRAATLPRAVVFHLVLAFANIGLAATLGILIGFDKVYHFLPGFVLTNVFAHAHLAAIGWASMIVVGVAYRLLPMVLATAMPNERRLWASAALLESGVLGLFIALLRRGSWSSRAPTKTASTRFRACHRRQTEPRGRGPASCSDPACNTARSVD
jgi:hypothetical protein